MPEDLIKPQRLHVEPQPDVDKRLRACMPRSLHKAIDHASGTEDPVYSALPAPRMLTASRTALEDWEGWWLDEGFHYDLHVEHRPLETAGPFTGGGNKLCWHITVSPWNTVDMIWTVLRDKRAAPHLIIGGRSGVVKPVVIQCIPFNLAGRALAHPSGPETNRADTIQIEVCADVDDVADFGSKHRYQAFANLARLINVRAPESREIPRRLVRSFQNTARLGGQQFVDASGHHGHLHVPGNDHTDPTPDFRGDVLMDRLADMPSGGYDL